MLKFCFKLKDGQRVPILPKAAPLLPSPDDGETKIEILVWRNQFLRILGCQKNRQNKCPAKINDFTVTSTTLNLPTGISGAILDVEG